MFHFLISGSEDSWQGHVDTLPFARCLKSNENTAAHLVHEYGQFTPQQNNMLTQIPAIFAYETTLKKDARLGRILAMNKSGQNVRIGFQFLDAYPPIPNEVLHAKRDELEIEEFEFYRTHWALKDQNIGLALSDAGFPDIPFTDQPLINVRKHIFDVSLSFPGQVRDYIETVAKQLVRILGNNSVFYDKFYKSQLAIPNLDTALQDLYRHRSKLVVVFLSADYAIKKWCGIEFRAIREIINEKQDEMIMFIRFDSADIHGVFSHDGYIDAKEHSAIEVAAMIHERVRLIRMQ